MYNKVIDFPQYRMLSNQKTFYKITSLNHFEEIQLMGTKVIYHAIEAIQYPEQLKIRDLINLEGNHYLVSDVTTWNNYFQKTKLL